MSSLRAILKQQFYSIFVHNENKVVVFLKSNFTLEGTYLFDTTDFFCSRRNFGCIQTSEIRVATTSQASVQNC